MRSIDLKRQKDASKTNVFQVDAALAENRTKPKKEDKDVS
jgi:hypothetical protein